MLGYELFSINKESSANNPRGGSQPIKKIFFENGKVTIDKDLEEYTSDRLEKSHTKDDDLPFLQWFMKRYIKTHKKLL